MSQVQVSYKRKIAKFGLLKKLVDSGKIGGGGRSFRKKYVMNEKASNKSWDNKRSLTEDWWKEENAARILSHWFVNHTIALSVGYVVGGEIYEQTYSGFLLYYHNRYMWITAGHIIEEIDKMFKSNSCEILGVRWIDDYDVEDARVIPVDYEKLPKCGINNREVDLGIVGFTPLDLASIRKNPRNKWLTSKVWKNNHLAKPDGFYIVGYPAKAAELKTRKTDGGFDCRLNLWLICNPIEKIEVRKPECAGDFWDHPGWFYGRILPVTWQDGQYLDDIGGMSGGPIFSLERTSNGNIKYRLFAIQSSWLPESKVLCGTPINRVVELIDEGFKAVEKEGGVD